MSGTEVELDRPQDLLNALPAERDGAMRRRQRQLGRPGIATDGNSC